MTKQVKASGIRATPDIIINSNIWKDSKLSRPEFLRRLSPVENLRCKLADELKQISTVWPVFSYLPTKPRGWANLESLYTLVRKGDFSPFARLDEYVFAVIFAPNLVRWLMDNGFSSIQGQIINWLAARACFVGRYGNERLLGLPQSVCEQIRQMQRDAYGAVFARSYLSKLTGKNYLAAINKLCERYHEVSRQYFGGAPEFLAVRDYETNIVDASAWGLSRGNSGKLDSTFAYRSIYMSRTDWKCIVVNGERTSFERKEGDSEVWMRWLATFKRLQH